MSVPVSVSAIKQTAASRIEADSAALAGLSRRIHAHPELAFAEERASRWCAEMLLAAGFDVERGVGGLPTALRATAGSGSLRVALCAEYDALPGIGHACGHNVICAASLGAAIGAASAADAADLTVIVLGTPAEELFGLRDIPAGVAGAGKAVLLEAGVYDDVHAALMCHPAPVDIAAASTRAITRFRASFAVTGAGTSPILASPADLLPADQAVTACQVAAGELRAGAPAGCSVHLVHSVGCWGLAAHGEKSASADFAVWGDDLGDVEAMASRLEECAKAAADATGTRVQAERLVPYAPMRHDPDLVAMYLANATALGRTFPDLGPLADHLGFATDMGNVSRRIPAIHPLIGIQTSALNHQPEFAAACATPSADRAVLDGAMALAWTVIDAALSPATRDRLLRGS